MSSPPRRREVALRLALLALVTPLLATGCSHVAPYERGKLAHLTSTDALEGRAAAHTNAVHEGAMGGGGVAESGCGCN